MTKLRVLHVIGGGDTGGAMTHLLPLLTALDAKECDVHLLCLGEGGLAENARSRGLPVQVLSMRNAWDPSALGPLRRVLSAGPGDRHSAESWDVVHTHGMRANLPVRSLLPRGKRRPCLLTTVHSDLLLDYGSPALARTYQVLDVATAPLVDTIICVSESLRSLLVERGYPRDKLVSIWSGVETSTAAHDGRAGGPEAGLALRSRPGRRDDGGSSPRIGTVARLVSVKDLALLLEVVARLQQSLPGLRCLVVGDGPERARLEARAAELGISRALEFPGRLDDIRGPLASLDVYVVTSVFEGGVSMSALEAMSAGLPVVTTEAGGVAEAVKDGETGFVVDRGQDRGALVSALAERIAALLGDHELRVRMGEAGAARVRAEFLVERTASRTLRVYRRCLIARGRRLTMGTA